MHRSFLLFGHSANGEIDEIVGTFDTPELAQTFVEQGIGADATWMGMDCGVWISYGTCKRWTIRELPHNMVDALDWAVE